MKESYEQVNETLCAQLRRISPEKLPGFLRQREPEMLAGINPFAGYMRRKLREKGVLQQEVFLAADLSEGYGYKLISGEKHTVSRDVILRLCFAGSFDRPETQEALILYGMAPLYGRLPRDAVLLAALEFRLRRIEDVNELLIRCGQPPLLDNWG